MLKLFRCAMASILFPLIVRSDTCTDTVCSGMLSELQSCFSGGLSIERLINEWRWGSIKWAFSFNFKEVSPEKESVCWIFAACPSSSNANAVSVFRDFPKVSDLESRDKPYFMFGVKKTGVNEKQSLEFVYCSKRSVMYPGFLNHLNVREPTYEDVRVTESSQCWATHVYGTNIFHYSRIDDQFVQWRSLGHGLDLVYRFNERECQGAMLILRESPQPEKMKVTGSNTVDVLDLRRLTPGFRWVPDHEVARFISYTTGRIAQGRVSENAYKSLWNKKIAQFQNNGDYMKSLRFSYIGGVETMITGFDITWSNFSYYLLPNNLVALRCAVEPCGFFNYERVESFVFDVRAMAEGTQVLLPNGLDIRPYYHSHPTDKVLYEHVRMDGKFRIVVQPYIAYLYDNGRLSKVLVCGSEKGPADHGWSLQSKFYFDGDRDAERYGWPVQRAYCPVED